MKNWLKQVRMLRVVDAAIRGGEPVNCAWLVAQHGQCSKSWQGVVNQLRSLGAPLEFSGNSRGAGGIYSYSGRWSLWKSIEQHVDASLTSQQT